MEPVNFYNLLKNGPEEMSSGDWGQVLDAVITRGRDMAQDSDASLEALQNILFEWSEEWTDRRMKIIRGAENESANPVRRSEYCLKSLRNIVAEASKDSARYEKSPELSLVERQVSDHLRKLHERRVVHSCRLRTKQGKDICNLWGLSDWGASCRERQPEKHVDRVREEIPIIPAYRGGKGVFDYATVLPTYIPKMLTLHGAAMSTSQIKSVVVSRISPPIVQIFDNPGIGEEYDADCGASYLGFCRMASPEDLMAEAESKKAFLYGLTDRERQVLEFKEDGLSIDEIAQKLGCSKRTVNDAWRSIFEKCKETLAA
jgi:hypothetical protein